MGLEEELAGIAAAYGGTGAPVLHPTRTDVVVLRRGEVVVKAHSARDDAGELRVRLRAAASPAVSAVMLAPLDPEVLTVGGRAVTVWPAGRPVRQDDLDDAPWEEGARLLAALHAVPLTLLPALPAAGGPARAARAVERMGGDGPVEALIRRAFKGLPAPVPAPALLTHGDWHLGQLVRRDRWLLIDVDDLGVGDPAWDLARPAAWYAAGLLEPAVWERFLGAYLGAGGPALGSGADPWSRLDVPARALTVQLAAVAVVNAEREGRELDEVEHSLVESCNRIVRA
ncbi:aminoglycoside phosphotransferase family protein [Actinomadura sp. ATCC 31491]|uniref:Aminoglycoside phosphotransferase family protein n=1 Tax=Actinomadura luzonensis TaxID=2805427 RepID=A0ABT0G316_9ACTN|nr:phosphotransferase [Actinomadura luzonensis]MCK2218879.1 aminoglycoside phosphotransferase family protein [Actinomadura luzonensis]